MTPIEMTQLVRTVDTEEELPAPVLARCGVDGTLWARLVEEAGWTVHERWTDEGWLLGWLPETGIALRTITDPDGDPVYGCAVYAEDGAGTMWFRDQYRCWEAVTAEALYWWSRDDSLCPTAKLPEQVADLPDRLRRPYTGQ